VAIKIFNERVILKGVLRKKNHRNYRP